MCFFIIRKYIVYNIKSYQTNVKLAVLEFEFIEKSLNLHTVLLLSRQKLNST